MSKKLPSKIELISRFLDSSDIKLIQEIFDLPEISDLTTLDQENPFKELYESKESKAKIEKILKSNPNLEENIRKAIKVWSNLELIKERSISLKRQRQKVIVIGLENAGKTAIISRLGRSLGIKGIASLKPTRGIEHRGIETCDSSFIVWDFGGQRSYREEYLLNEANFLNISLLIYVIDIQDPEKFDGSLQYFNKILNLLIKMNEYPHILVLIHKYDPDIRDDSEIMLRVELIQHKIDLLFKEKEFNYEIYLSSIYSQISKEPQISTLIKKVLGDSNSFLYDKEATSSKIKSLGDTITTSINAIIRLSEYCNELENRINSLEKIIAQLAKTQDFLPAPVSASSPAITPPISQDFATSGGVRQSIINELKHMFAIRKGIESK